jgi:hypothetical protein
MLFLNASRQRRWEMHSALAIYEALSEETRNWHSAHVLFSQADFIYWDLEDNRSSPCNVYSRKYRHLRWGGELLLVASWISSDHTGALPLVSRASPPSSSLSIIHLWADHRRLHPYLYSIFKPRRPPNLSFIPPTDDS